MPLAAAALLGASVAGSAEAGVRMFSVNWTLPSTGELYVSLNNLTSGPTTSASMVSGWDMRIASPAARTSLEFTFPALPGTATGSNPYYGIMRAPGSTSGPGANLSLLTQVSGSSSFSDGGPVVFGSGAHEWRLNGENYLGFRMRLGTTGNLIFHGWARLVTGSVPGQFTITNFAYQDISGASIRVGDGMPIPGPGAVALFAALGAARRRRRA